MPKTRTIFYAARVFICCLIKIFYASGKCFNPQHIPSNQITSNHFTSNRILEERLRKLNPKIPQITSFCLPCVKKLMGGRPKKDQDCPEIEEKVLRQILEQRMVKETDNLKTISVGGKPGDKMIFINAPNRKKSSKNCLSR